MVRLHDDGLADYLLQKNFFSLRPAPADIEEGEQIVAHRLGRNLRVIALDQPALAELADALVDRRCGEANLHGKLRLRRARVLLQQLDQRKVGFVEVGHRRSSRD